MSNLVSNAINIRTECLGNEYKKVMLNVKNHARKINSLHGSKIQ
jgi:hypothetical protein